jgi:hypothetical protein
MTLRFPHYILLSFGTFMCYILFLVVKTSYVNNELVAEDYYAQELNYQEKINHMNHVGTDQKAVWKQEDGQLILSFPSTTNTKEITGKLEFYRPSDASKDLKIPLVLNANKQQVFPRELFVRGMYLVKVDWKQKQTAYYSEQELYLP